MINDAVNEVDETFAVLAEPARRLVVELLSVRPMRAGEIAERVGMSRPAMSRHLRLLRESGLVEVDSSDQDARARTYRLSAARLVALQAWLDQVQAYWSTQLASFKRQAER